MIHRLSLVILAGLLAASLAPSAVAQDSIADELQRLRDENAKLRQDLERAQQRIEDLERQIARLSARPAPDPAATGAPPAVTVDETVPDASPRALHSALQKSYEEAVGDLAKGPGDRERRVYLQEVRRWAASANQRFRSSIEWHMRVEESMSTSRGYLMRVTAVDPSTRAELGAPFEILVPRSRARQLERRPGLADDVLVLKGVLIPMVSVNPERPEAGPFDNPPLLGPFAEFRFRVEATAVMPPPAPADDAEGADG